jgi:(2Fe-2S) ferredoxin
MSKHQQKLICHLEGYLLRWGDDRIPHRYLNLATTNGEKLVKIAKSLRSQTQDWQPGIYLALLGSEQIDRSTGKTKIKVKQLLNTPQLDCPPINQVSTSSPANSKVNLPLAKPPLCGIEPTIIRVCQGSSCRRRGSEQICRSMQAYLTQNDLTERVEIETTKCLHQCKAAPHAIVHSPNTATLPGKTHYRQLQLVQVQTMLSKHFPIVVDPLPRCSNLIEKIGNYLNQQHSSSSNPLS